MTFAVVTFLWKPAPGYRSKFTYEHVNVLRRMVARHYQAPHEFVCVTDDPRGLDRGIRVVPLWDDYANLPSPVGADHPSCFRRLRLFSVEMATVIGPRFVCLDLDCVVTGDMRPLWDRPEDFVIWAGQVKGRSWVNGSMFLMRAGSRREVWDDFHPTQSPRLAKQAGFFGSDQAWISYRLGPNIPRWGTVDGVYSWRVHIEPHAGGRRLPDNARIVFFNGKTDPWSEKERHVPWIRKNWK